MRNKAGEYIVPGFIASVGMLLFIESYSIKISEAALRSGIMTSEFFPRLVAAGLILLSLATIIITYIKGKQKTEPDETSKSSEISKLAGDQTPDLVFSPPIGLLVAVALIGLFFVMFRPVGFILAGFVFTAAYSYLFGPRKIVVSLVFSLVYVGIVFVVFRYAFRVIAPGGVLY